MECVTEQTAEQPCGVFVVGEYHDSWKVPESQMTGDKAQHESGKHKTDRQRGRHKTQKGRK